MSEEILKALTQLFAIFSKQDGGVLEEERDFVIQFFNQELNKSSIKEYLELFDKLSGYGEEQQQEKRLTSVKDSVRTLGICKKINKTLTQKQKIVVLIKIMELVDADDNTSTQKLEILDTVSTVFNFDKAEFKIIEDFIFRGTGSQQELDHPEILIANSDESLEVENAKHLHLHVDGNLVFLKVNSVDMYFLMYNGQDEINLNGFTIKYGTVHLFSNGSTLKTPEGDVVYFSDLVSHFLSDLTVSNISFEAKDLYFKFPNGDLGLRNINISEGSGKLIGIMGASGAGKTTLLNVLAGIEKPSDGTLEINGINIHDNKDDIHGVIGYISQDDLLIEELTVYQNLYYNAKLCFANLSEEELDKRVIAVLTSLGLEQRKDLKVGSVLDKTISGGQRKRLNIALELIREPAVMFVDEPTSGLSSRDSENVIDLLKELSLKGKLIFVVIHQPSSDIYKMFDKMYLMDTGGYPVFYGHPVEAVSYFKEATNQVDKNKGQCPTCSNVNPEQIFNIIEAKVVDEYGQLTGKRKVNPDHWNQQYLDKFKVAKVKQVVEKPPHMLDIPSKIKQAFIFTVRDTLSKLANRQYLLINLLQAPALAFILAFIIKYKSSPDGGEYIFRYNENLPAFILMAIVVALFMGLSVSAEEIIRDRKILKRESFLNLSWGSYLTSKIIILFTMSAIQTMSFVLIGNFILEIRGMTMAFWLVLFSVSCGANLIGLNISSSFKSAVTVYIIIPLILIPQMILSGLLFSFDKLHPIISSETKVPIIADLMLSRWAYEAIAVDLFKENNYQEPFFNLEKEQLDADYKAAFVVKRLKEKQEEIQRRMNSGNDSLKNLTIPDFQLILNTLSDEPFKKGIENLDLAKALTTDGYTLDVHNTLLMYFNEMEDYYNNAYVLALRKKEKMIGFLENNASGRYSLKEEKDKYFNQSLSDIVRNINAEVRMVESDNKLVRKIDPIYNTDYEISGPLDYRAPFYAPKKRVFNTVNDTYLFNIAVIWLMSMIFYIALYFEALSKLLNSFGKLKITKK